MAVRVKRVIGGKAGGAGGRGGNQTDMDSEACSWWDRVWRNEDSTRTLEGGLQTEDTDQRMVTSALCTNKVVGCSVSNLVACTANVIITARSGFCPPASTAFEVQCTALQGATPLHVHATKEMKCTRQPSARG